MSWSRKNSEVLSISTQPGNANVLVSVRFTNPDTGETHTRNDLIGNDLDANKLGLICDRIAELLNTRDSSLATFKDAGVVVGQPVPAPVPPDQKKVDADTFFADYTNMLALQASVDQGFIKVDDKTFTDLQVKVKTEFLPEYTSDPRWKK